MSRNGKSSYSRGLQNCIFCGNGGVTGEHIYSKWMHSYLCLGPKYGRTEFREHIESLPDNRGVSLTRKGKIRKTERVVSTKLKIVCRDCNNGWMSGIEMQAREALIKLIKGDLHCITVANQSSLVAWMAMKLMLLNEQRRDSPVFRATEYRNFGRSVEFRTVLRFGLLRIRGSHGDTDGIP
jgi:hypothetical protein